MSDRSFGKDFKRFFFRGLAIVFPTLMTITLIVWAYSKIQVLVAEPINHGLRKLVITTTSWPQASDSDYDWIYTNDDQIRNTWDEGVRPSLQAPNENQPLGLNYWPTQRREWMQDQAGIVHDARLYALKNKWDSIRIGNWKTLNMIGLIIAVIVIYIIGVILGSFIGRSMYARGEKMLDRVPLIRRIYPAFKQIAEFIVPDGESSDDKKIQFSRVVAVQYPRNGIWSVGLVTGDTMKRMQEEAGQPCLTIFIPSSPTPFTGYVITVPVADTIDLPITIEDALKFAISGGVLVPPNQQIPQAPASTQAP